MRQKHVSVNGFTMIEALLVLGILPLVLFFAFGLLSKYTKEIKVAQDLGIKEDLRSYIRQRINCVNTASELSKCDTSDFIHGFDHNGNEIVPDALNGRAFDDVQMRLSCEMGDRVSMDIHIEAKLPGKQNFERITNVPIACENSECRIEDIIDKQVVFFTSKRYRGDWGRNKPDRNAYVNSECTQIAHAAGFDGEWIGLIATAAGPHPIDLVDIPGPIYNTNCEIVANGKADFWDGNFETPIKYDELRNPSEQHPNYGVWTGFDEFGKKAGPPCPNYCDSHWSSSCLRRYHNCGRSGYSSSTCNDWTTAPSAGVAAMAGGGWWTDWKVFWQVVTTTCDRNLRFYCIKKVL